MTSIWVNCQIEQLQCKQLACAASRCVRCKHLLHHAPNPRVPCDSYQVAICCQPRPLGGYTHCPKPHTGTSSCLHNDIVMSTLLLLLKVILQLLPRSGSFLIQTSAEQINLFLWRMLASHDMANVQHHTTPLGHVQTSDPP